MAFHFVIDPRTDEHSAISPIVRPVPLDIVVCEVAVIRASVGPREAALSMFHSVNVQSVVLGSIRPSLDALPVLLVLLPVALVLGTVEMVVDTLTVCLIILPHSVIDFTVCMDETTFSAGTSIFQPSFIHGTIWQLLSSTTSSVGRALDPLALIFGLIFYDLFLAKF